MLRLFSSTILVLLYLTSTLWAQDTRTITLEEAITTSLENNYQLKVAQNNLELAKQSIKSEYADFAPTITSSLSGSRSTGRQFIFDRLSDPTLNPFVNVTSQSISGRLNANIVIFDGFNNINTLRASKQSKVSVEESYQRAKEQVIFNTASKYLQVLLSVELLDIAKENLTNSQQQYEQVKAQVEVGSRPTVDLYNQEAQVANDELTVTQRENSHKFNKLVLVRQLQIDPLGNYEFIVPEAVFDTEGVGGESFALSELIDQALLNRSDIRGEVANIHSLQFRLQVAKGSLYPTLSGSIGISSRYSDQYSLPGAQGSVNFGEQFFDQQINRSLGLSLNVPIFQNWNRVYNIQSSKVQLKNAKLNLDNARLQVIQEVAQAYNDYTSYQKQVLASKKSLKASERAFETQQARYNVGSSTLIEMSQAQAGYVEAQSNHTQAMYNLIFQEKLLDFYLGKLSGDSVQF